MRSLRCETHAILIFRQRREKINFKKYKYIEYKLKIVKVEALKSIENNIKLFPFKILDYKCTYYNSRAYIKYTCK